MKLLLAVSAAILVARCAGVTYYSGPISRENMVMFNTRGDLVDPATGCADLAKCAHPTGQRFDELVGECETRYIENIARAIEARSDRKVLLYIHGGLNDPTGTIERAVSRTPLIEPSYYPIFINWQSSLPTSYRDHLLRVHQGRFFEYSRGRWCFGAFKLPLDIARAKWRSPIASYFETVNYAQSTRWSKEMELWRQVAEKEQRRIETSPTPDAEINLVYYPPQPTSELRNGVSWGLPLPMRFLAAAVIDAGGTPAWEVMLHRAYSLIHRDPDFDPAGHHAPSDRPVFHDPSGGLHRLLARLSKIEGVRITLIGHSMGAIVANEILRSFPDLPVENIVYMAAACSIHDYETSVLSFVDRRDDLKRRGADVIVPKIYMLTLDMQSEVSERRMYAPSGTLLVWIDDYFSHPETRHHRTAGRFTNLLGAVHNTPAKVRNYLTITSFQRHGQNMPQTHGSFGDFPFWDERFWRGEALPRVGTRLDPQDPQFRRQVAAPGRDNRPVANTGRAKKLEAQPQCPTP